MKAALVAFYFLFPALIMFQSMKRPIINRIGIVVICYAAGLLLGNINLIPESMGGMQGTLMGVTILLGIPLVLLSENVIKWAKMARITFISLILGVVSVVVLVVLGDIVFDGRIPNLWKISGMMIRGVHRRNGEPGRHRPGPGGGGGDVPAGQPTRPRSSSRYHPVVPRSWGPSPSSACFSDPTSPTGARNSPKSTWPTTRATRDSFPAKGFPDTEGPGRLLPDLRRGLWTVPAL
ncbi:MAG: hypothetical protein R2751_08290 [Bacteroidales bacterium]